MDSIESLAPIREITAAVCARYATVTPEGIVLPGASSPYNPLPVTVVTYKPGRTCYVNKHPICRSLNGIHSVTTNRRCLSCDQKRSCTPRVVLEVLYRNVPFRIMLAYTSAKNFMDFCRTIHKPKTGIQGVMTEISVLNRGHWGEVRFKLPQ